MFYSTNRPRSNAKIKSLPSSPHILVTGAGGFLGSAIVSELKRRNIQVRATSSRGGDGIIAADLTRPEPLPSLLDGIQCVIHSAGVAHVFRIDKNEEERMMRVNAGAVGLLAQACARAGVAHLILISSVSVYGSPGAAMVDESFACRPTGPYAVSKYEGEAAAVAMTKGSQTRLSILRPATIYGEGDRGNVARLIRAVQRRRFFWIGDGSNRKSLIHRDDVATACVEVALQGARQDGVFNVAGEAHTMRQIVDSIAAAGRQKPPSLSMPAGFALSLTKLPGAARFRKTIEKWLADDSYDGARLQRTYGWRPSVPLAEGLRREVEWVRSC
jgi:UDP-glucose 4-epimerase